MSAERLGPVASAKALGRPPGNKRGGRAGRRPGRRGACRARTSARWTRGSRLAIRGSSAEAASTTVPVRAHAATAPVHAEVGFSGTLERQALDGRGQDDALVADDRGLDLELVEDRGQLAGRDKPATHRGQRPGEALLRGPWVWWIVDRRHALGRRAGRVHGGGRLRRGEALCQAPEEGLAVHGSSTSRAPSARGSSARAGVATRALASRRGRAAAPARAARRRRAGSPLRANALGFDHARAHARHRARSRASPCCRPRPRALRAAARGGGSRPGTPSSTRRTATRRAGARRPRARRRAAADDGADRPGVDRAVGVAADLAVDGAGVQARAAADAVQRLLARAAQDVRAPVVDDDQVQLRGTVAVVGRAGRSRN